MSTTIWRSKAGKIRTENVANNSGNCALKLLFFLDLKWLSKNAGNADQWHGNEPNVLT